MIILLGIIGVFLIGAYFFVQWANRPENVAATLKQYEEDKLRKAEQDSLAKLALQAEAAIQQKTEADLQLVFEENFQNNAMGSEMEDFKLKKVSFKDNKLTFYDGLVLPTKRVKYVLGISKGNVENFVAELQFENREGCRIATGIIFNVDAKPDGSFSGNCATVGEYAETYIGGTERESLGDLEDSKQFTVRFQKKGKLFTITVNNKLVLTHKVEEYLRPDGKIGLFVDYYNNSKDFNRSAKVTITKFKVWKW